MTGAGATVAPAGPLGVRARLDTADGPVAFVRLRRLAELGICDVDRLPAVTRILLESVLRQGPSWGMTDDALAALARAVAVGDDAELPFLPARVLLTDFNGVPALADLAALRSRIAALGGDPAAFDLALPCHLVVDHSVRVDHAGVADARARNLAGEYARNAERYAFLRWAQRAFDGLDVVPPGRGICHQINFERLADVVTVRDDGSGPLALPDSVLGSDSHTTMINGLGVVGFGVGAIEAEAALLGRPLSLTTPRVVGLRLTGAPPAGVLATDVVLAVTERLRAAGVVDAFVEVVGPGVEALSVPDRGVVANMAPDFGATSCHFGVDDATLAFLRLTGRAEGTVDLVERYARAQGLFREPDAEEPTFDRVVELDLGAVEPSLAGPSRPNERRALADVPASFAARRGAGGRPAPVGAGPGPPDAAPGAAPSAPAPEGPPPAAPDSPVRDGSVVIAAITSCTNTSNPAAMVTAGLLARNAVARGLTVPAWVKTSLAPGSRAVVGYLEEAGLMDDLEALGFGVVGYGCTTCCGNSGQLAPAVDAALAEHPHDVVAVLSGNRNYAGRIHPLVRANYLASPPLVVAYALAGRIDRNLRAEPVGHGADGEPVTLDELWPTPAEVDAALAVVRPEVFRGAYADLFDGDAAWDALPEHDGAEYGWDPASTYLRPPPFVTEIEADPTPPGDVVGARALAVLGDHVTTDHISPVGRILPGSPAAEHLVARGVPEREHDSFGTRRGNWEVMVRGTFDYVALENALVAPVTGGVTRDHATGETVSIHEASRRAAGTPLVVLAGGEYGAGSSRDWAAKGTALLGVRAVIAGGYERIHRSNLVGMGVLPLQVLPGASVGTLGLTGSETFDVRGVEEATRRCGARLQVVARDGARTTTFDVVCRIDTESELRTFAAGGLLPLVLRDHVLEVTR